MYLYIVISNKSASEHNIRPNKKVYTELAYTRAPHGVEWVAKGG